MVQEKELETKNIEQNQIDTIILALDNLLYIDGFFPFLDIVEENIAAGEDTEEKPENSYHTVHHFTGEAQVEIDGNFDASAALGALEKVEISDYFFAELTYRVGNTLSYFQEQNDIVSRGFVSIIEEVPVASVDEKPEILAEAVIESIKGGSKKDTITVKATDKDIIYYFDTGAGNDTVKLGGTYKSSIVKLGAGNDKFEGGDAPDIVYGGAGKDTLSGGGSADRFVFTADDKGKTDTIRDFSVIEGDIIEIRDILIGFDPLSDAITDFISQSVKGKNTTISVDPDGRGSAFGSFDLVVLQNVKGLDISGLYDDGQIVIS